MTQELYRDQDHGFVLTIYTENKDQYRIPHDHGSCWVVYAVIKGIMEMGSYHLVDSGIQRFDLYHLKAGDVKVYLPGEIHDTLCLSEEATILRLTSCDLKVEEMEGRMRRYQTE